MRKSQKSSVFFIIFIIIIIARGEGRQVTTVTGFAVELVVWEEAKSCPAPSLQGTSPNSRFLPLFWVTKGFHISPFLGVGHKGFQV